MTRWTIILVAGLLACGAATANADRTEYVNEGFEGTTFPPAGWAIIANAPAYSWTQNAARRHTGDFSTLLHYSPAGVVQDEWLVTPAMNTTGATSLALTFWESGQYWNALYGDHHYVMVSTTSQTDPAAFSVLLDMTPADHPIPSTWQQVTLDLSAYIDQPTVYIALRYTDHGGSEDNWWVDDVWIRQAEQHDVKVVSLSPLETEYVDGASFAPQVVVQNIGAFVETFDVTCTITESGAPAYEQTTTVANLIVGQSTVVSFPAYTVVPGNYLEIAAATRLAGDDDPDNDRRDGYNYAYTQTRIPHGLLVTCWDCSGCPDANASLDAYLASGHVDDTALMRVHCWWPGGGDDPMYLANVEQATALVEGTPTGSDYAPHLWLDGNVDAGADNAAFAGMLEYRRLRGGPLTLDVAFDPLTSRIRATVDVVEPLVPGRVCRLFAAITEDDIYAAGSNGEVWHHQVFRHLYPDIEGLPFAATPGPQVLELDASLDPGWVYENLRLVVYAMDVTTHRVLNAATMALPGAGTPVATGLPPATRLTGAAPNPFNPLTTITFAAGRAGLVRLAVYDVRGREVVELLRGVVEAGEHRVSWQGTDAAGQEMPSGMYFVRLEWGANAQTGKLVLVR